MSPPLPVAKSANGTGSYRDALNIKSPVANLTMPAGVIDRKNAEGPARAPINGCVAESTVRGLFQIAGASPNRAVIWSLRSSMNRTHLRRLPHS